ncbi:hypothetical protein LIER_26587 [Lithospermum erythrorhizon]|uniref:Uncharacterized protein n=1 Tax=Lithospermum erythrorhizon TaxID=34254 RepID=A0AAV3RCJ6_LITER
MDDVESMEFVEVPSATGTEDVTAGLADDNVTQSVVDSSVDVVDLPEEMAEQTVGEGDDDTLIADIKVLLVVEEEADNVQQVAEEQTVKEQMLVNVRPTGSDSWNPADE